MTELIRNWLLGVTCAAMILALAESLAPEGSVKRICRLAGGLVLLLAAIGPVLKLDEADLTQITERYQLSAQEYSRELEAKNDFLYETIIEENAAAYILDKAEELGMTCRVSVTAEWEDGTPIPRSVTIKGTWTRQQREELSRLLEDDLGIPVPMQYFEETES